MSSCMARHLMFQTWMISSFQSVNKASAQKSSTFGQSAHWIRTQLSKVSRKRTVWFALKRVGGNPVLAQKSLRALLQRRLITSMLRLNVCFKLMCRYHMLRT
ncbi:UNVERIFIED_CONTAM: hypothetical protein GTU68_032086 [Idotea baltica]|nr:hypothetical protein [Idotea baltica]